MRLATVAALTILSLFVPHQAPFAGPSNAGEPNAAGDTAGSVELGATPGEARNEPGRRDALVVDEGFVWSVTPSSDASLAWSPESRHLETDGYSWSVSSR